MYMHDKMYTYFDQNGQQYLSFNQNYLKNLHFWP